MKPANRLMAGMAAAMGLLAVVTVGTAVLATPTVGSRALTNDTTPYSLVILDGAITTSYPVNEYKDGRIIKTYPKGSKFTLQLVAFRAATNPYIYIATSNNAVYATNWKSTTFQYRLLRPDGTLAREFAAPVDVVCFESPTTNEKRVTIQGSAPLGSNDYGKAVFVQLMTTATVTNKFI